MSLLDQLPTYAYLVGRSFHLREKSSFLMVMLSRQLSRRPSRSDKMLLVTHAKSISVHEVDVNRLYFEVVGGEKKRRVYGLGSQALTLYPDSNSATSRTLHDVPDHVAEERIKVPEEEVLRMRETQERIL
nr:uncharacterized protein LOC117279848 [Nicotiana tomentosiformis]